jgi:hypothetical protein
VGDNIKMYLKEIEREFVDWIYLARETDRWLAVVNAVMSLRVPHNSGNIMTSWTTVTFSKGTVLKELYYGLDHHSSDDMNI